MSNDILTNADKIEHQNKIIEEFLDLIDGATTLKAEALRDHKKDVALTSLKIKEGLITEFEGVKLPIKVTDTFLKTIIEGMCYQSLYNMTQATDSYKSLIVKLDGKKAILNGLQSINRHLQ